MRKIYLLLLCSMLSVSQLSAQINNQSASLPTGTVSLVLEDRTVNDRLHPDIVGSALLTDDWSQGAVTMINGQHFYNVYLLFNIYDNILYFRRGEKEMCEFSIPVREFIFRYLKGNDSARALYRSGFPATGKNTENTFYEVLADGKFILLNFHSKVLVKVKGDYVRKDAYNKFEDKSQLYLYDATHGKLTRLDTIDDLKAAVGAPADAAAQALGKTKIKLKNEEEVAALVAAINKQL